MTKQYRSKLEQTFAKQHPSLPYEDTRLTYDVTHTYTPDFKLDTNVFVEVKGLFDGADRAKHLHIRKQHPLVTIVFVFQNPHLKLAPTSKTTYADWCDKYGFKWFHINQTAQLEQIKFVSNKVVSPPLTELIPLVSRRNLNKPIASIPSTIHKGTSTYTYVRADGTYYHCAEPDEWHTKHNVPMMEKLIPPNFKLTVIEGGKEEQEPAQVVTCDIAVELIAAVGGTQ